MKQEISAGENQGDGVIDGKATHVLAKSFEEAYYAAGRAFLCEALEYGADHQSWDAWFSTPEAITFTPSGLDPLGKTELTEDWARQTAEGRAADTLLALWHDATMAPDHICDLAGVERGRSYAAIVQYLRRGSRPSKPVGRPPKYGQRMATVTVTLPKSTLQVFEFMAAQLGLSKAEAFRQAIDTVTAEWVSVHREEFDEAFYKLKTSVEKEKWDEQRSRTSAKDIQPRDSGWLQKIADDIGVRRGNRPTSEYDSEVTPLESLAHIERR